MLDIKKILNIQNNQKKSWIQTCCNCGEKVSIFESDRIKYTPKSFCKLCPKCGSTLEGEWKKLIKG